MFLHKVLLFDQFLFLVFEIFNISKKYTIIVEAAKVVVGCLVLT
jgi:hypothetical protein